MNLSLILSYTLFVSVRWWCSWTDRWRMARMCVWEMGAWRVYWLWWSSKWQGENMSVQCALVITLLFIVQSWNEKKTFMGKECLVEQLYQVSYQYKQQCWWWTAKGTKLPILEYTHQCILTVILVRHADNWFPTASVHSIQIAATPDVCAGFSGNNNMPIISHLRYWP